MTKKKRNQQSSSESEDEDSEQFVVEVITAAKIHESKWEYWVKWANYPSSANSWEPEENLTNCSRLLESFWKDVGYDDRDYFEGYKVEATPSWIKREKKRFANSLRPPDTESSSEEEKPRPSTSQVKVEPQAPAKGKGKATAKPPHKKRGRLPKAKARQQDDGSESVNVPLSATRAKGKKRAKAIIDSADEDDGPSAEVKKTRPTITIPAQKSAHEHDAEHSDSAGSLFSERASSPEVALGSTVSRGPSTTQKVTVPMKRPSVDDTMSGQRKRQVMEMPMPITGTAGNATKARLAQRVPQVPPQGTTSASEVLPKQKQDLSMMRFKKNVPATAGPSPVNTAPVPPLPRGPGSASSNSPVPSNHGTPTMEAHVPAVVAAQLSSTEPRRSIPLPRRNLSQQLHSPVTEPHAEAVKFLSGIMPPAMASSMQDEFMSDMPPPPVPTRPPQTKPGALPRIQKKWKWTGDLFMDVSRDKAEHVCEVALTDSTDPLPNGLRFSICLTGDSIRLSAFHDLASMPLFLLASVRVQQFAKVGPLEDKDADAVKQLGTYMQKGALFCFAHLYLDETSVGLLVVYPTDHAIAKKILKPPSTLSNSTPLQVALVPWELTTKEFRSANWKSRTPTVERTLDPQFVPVLDTAGRQITTQRRFYQALHILGFPKTLFDSMSQPRSYCIWTGPADTTSTSPGYETVLLKEVLSRTKSKDVGHKADVRIIFVHVGGLASLQHLPALAERRAKTDVRFITYGTHPSVPRERWGMREIYPLGGIVTFTPTAIIEGHLRLYNRIKQIAEHPTWECYVLPSVVAMVAKLTCQGEHPLRVYDEGNFVYEDLLKMIEQGTIALLQAPYVTRDPLSKGDPKLLWTQWMLRLPGMSARQILEECIRLAAEEFAHASNHDLGRAIEKEIARDLWRLQNQPTVMDNYRRFVVIRTQTDVQFAQDMRGFECSTLSTFDFRDNYYKPLAKPQK